MRERGKRNWKRIGILIVAGMAVIAAEGVSIWRDLNARTALEELWQERAAIEEQKTEDAAAEAEEATEAEGTETETATDAVQEAVEEETRERVLCDPSKYTQLRMPMETEAKYGYGFGYDERYRDIRFHKEMYFEADGMYAVKAVGDGVVSDVGEGVEGLFITIEHGAVSSTLSGLSEVEVSVGETVEKGQEIGKGCSVWYRLYE